MKRKPWRDECEEIWKDIVIERNGTLYDYTGLYQVSSLGRVRIVNYRGTGKTKIKKLQIPDGKYVSVSLTRDKKLETFYVHRLVANAFIPNPNNLPQVNHKDEDKTNNNVNNLEWCTSEYNINYGTRSKRQSETQTGMKFTEKRKKNISASKTGKCTGKDNPRARRVICIETGEIFETIKEASEWCKGNVKMCLSKNSKNKTAGGYHWMYYDEK